MKKVLLSPWTALITLVVMATLRAADPSFVESVRLRYFDSLVMSKPAVNDQITDSIVVANVDEATLDKRGQWPFKRGTYAEMMQELFDKGAKLVVWNVLMPEPDRFGEDAALASFMASHPVVLSNVPSSADKNAPKKPGSAVINSQFSDRLVNYGGVIANVQTIEKPAAGIGTTNTLPEIDGVNRRIPLVSASGSRIFPGLALETVRVLSGDSTVQVKLSTEGVDKLRVAKFGYFTTDALGRVWIDWSRKSQEISMASVPDLTGKVVVVGTTAAGIANPVPTARGPVWPHDLQATVLSTLLGKVVIVRPAWADWAEILAVVLLGLVVLAASRWTWSFVPVLAALGGSHFAASWAYTSHSYLVDVTALVASMSLVYMHAYTAKFVSEFLQKQQIKKQFGTYLSPAMVEKLQKNPSLLKLGGDTRELTLLFCDIRGFTPISEQYKTDPQGLTKLINRFLTPMTDVIMANEGTIDKYMGDCIMAFWNAPLDVEDQRKKAVHSALTMLSSLKGLNAELESEGLLPISIGIGLNTGSVVVGNMGSNQRFDYSCLGDAVNLASRLEGQSKGYGMKLILGAETAKGIQDSFLVLELDKIAVKGKKEGVNVYTALCEYRADWQLAANRHAMFLDLYRKQQWDEAILVATALESEFDGAMRAYYGIMKERIPDLREAGLGPDWDGVYVATSK
jgi:adenylate cyclase